MKVVKHQRTILGESPIWDPDTRFFYWVDILGKKILRSDQWGEKFKCWQFEHPICAIVPTNRSQLLVALSQTLAWFDTKSGKLFEISGTNVNHPTEMYNDGFVDAAGRLWIGSKDINESNPVGKIYCYDGVSHIVKDQGFIVSNGLDWSNDNTTFYFADSPTQNIYTYDFMLSPGDITNRTSFIKVNNGYPDGLTVSASGDLWGAHWDGGGLSQYDSNGKVVSFHELPARRVTSCCFGGDSYQTLFVTSAAYQLSTDLTEDGYAFLFDGLSQGREMNLFRAD